jgi:hypothetical protein
MQRNRWFDDTGVWTLPLLCAALFASCSAETPSVYQEVIDQGATRYFGKARVQKQYSDEGVTTYVFDPASGPVCLLGDPYKMSVRDTGSEDLFIFLQGGGACWSTFCFAINKAQDGIPPLDILNPAKETNPLAKVSTVYLPYCDGSLFVGDSEHDDDGDGQIDRRQHGLQNLSAALDIAERTFPNPKRIILAGSSGGGYGTILAALLVRARYAKPEILVFNDAGVGLGKPGEPAFLNQVLDEFNVRSILPKSCTDCVTNGHVTHLVDWELQHDPALKISVFSAYEDYVISTLFLQIEPAAFRQALVTETSWLQSRHPDRYRRFLVAGDVHTTLLGGIEGFIGDDPTAVTLPPGFLEKTQNVKLGGLDTTQLRGITVGQWFKAMLEGSAGWDDRVE